VRLETIVVGYHGKGSAERALELGSTIGRRTGSRLLLTLAYPPEGFTRTEAEQLLREAVRKLPYGQPAGVRAVDEASPGAALTRTALHEDARLVVLGAGPTATIVEQLAGTLTCPIAVAPALY
jgi:nucleotide-binding universal stress UspA family protein